MGKEDDTLSGKLLSDKHFKKARELLSDSSGLLDTVLDAMGDGLSIQDLNMRIVYQNKFMRDVFDPHIGDYCYKIYEKRGTPCEGCPVVEAYNTGKVTKALRVGILKYGSSFRFENISSALRNDQGEIVAGMELCRLVEDRERAFDDLRATMAQLRETQEQLIRSEKFAAVGQLVAGVAHEINNPSAFVLSNLGVIRDYVQEFLTFVETLEKFINIDFQEGPTRTKDIKAERTITFKNKDYVYLKNELPEVIQESLQGMQRIQAIVSGMMSFAHSINDRMSPANINSLLDSVLMLMEDKVAAKNGHIVKIFGKLPPCPAYPQQLNQMFMNILLNAIQAIRDGGTITVETYLKNSKINIRIADDGAGIPEDIIRKIFDPFYTTRKVGDGIGLGLSIVHRIAENHNGSVNVQSKPGAGTTFIIKLPRYSPENHSTKISTQPDLS